MNPHEQWMTLLWMMISGAAMGMAYDSYRVLAGELRFPKWSVHVIDLLYWIGAALFVFRMLYAANHGQLRFYVFVGLFAGVWIYFLIGSVTTRRFVVMLVQAAMSLLSILTTLLDVLLWKPLKLLFSLLKGSLKLIWRLMMVVLQVVWKLLTPLRAILRWICSPIISRLSMPAWGKKAADKFKAVWKRWF